MPGCKMDESTTHTDLPTAAEIRDALETAVRLQRREQFVEAEKIYASVLSLVPDEPNALNFLGVMRHQQGRVDEALHFIARSIQRQPAEGGPWLNLSNVLLESGQYDEAVEALKRVIELKPDSAGVYNNLAILHLRMGNREAAERCLLRVLEMDPKSGFGHANLSNLYYASKRFKESIDHGLQAVGSDRKGPGSARYMVVLSLLAMGERERAIENLRQWMEDEPDNPHPRHHITALGVGTVPERASDAYVRDEFDQFAMSFDSKLERLGYRAPGLVREALDSLGARLPTGGAILDAGCGTGLCGPLLRPLGARLVGVDLSGGMLEKARLRACYDELHHRELTEFIETCADRFDIIASADTLIYFGNLSPVMAAVRGALKPGGVIAATVEALADDSVDHVLQVNGRYAHSQSYIRSLVEHNGLELAVLRAEVLRKEEREDVSGWLFIAVKPVSAGSQQAGASHER